MSRILVLAPMKRECDNFLRALNEIPTKNSYKVVHCGVGKVNAAATVSAELVVDPTAYDQIVVVGYAAGSSWFHQGDTVIPSKCRYSDVNVPEGCVPEIEQTYELDGPDSDITVFTADSFVDGPSIDEILKKTNTRTPAIFDMEVTAIAQVAYEYNIPVTVLKYISDVPQLGHSVQSFEDFVNSHTDFTPFVSYLEDFSIF